MANVLVLLSKEKLTGTFINKMRVYGTLVYEIISCEYQMGFSKLILTY